MKVKVTEKRVMITEISEVLEGEFGINRCDFSLPKSFEGLCVTAVFNGIPVPLTDGKCIIPTLSNGNCILGVYAYRKNGEEMELMYSPKPTMFFVGKGSFCREINEEVIPEVFDYETYCQMLQGYWRELFGENTLSEYKADATEHQFYSAKASNEMHSDLYMQVPAVVPCDFQVETGYINNNLNGEITNVANPKYKYMETYIAQEDFVSCTFSIPSDVTCYFYYYDEDKKFVIKVKMVDGGALNKMNYAYGRFCAYTSGTELTEEAFRAMFDIKKKGTILVSKTDRKVPYPLNNNELEYGSPGQVMKTNGDGTTYWSDGAGDLKGLKLVTFGDSITYYDGHNFGSGHTECGTEAIGYQSYMRERLGCDVDNQGVSGYNLPEILEKIKGYDFSDTDIVTITSGANDHNDISLKTEALGSIAPIGSDFDESSFYGALQSAVEHILSENINAKIVLITPIKGWFSTGAMPEDYADAFKAVGKLYSIPVCDWYNESGINDITKSVYIGDITTSGKYLHPTNAGYKRMADTLLPFLQNH